MPELVSHSVGTNLVLGANVSLTDTMNIIKNVAEEKEESFWHLQKVYDHLDIVANVPVRNVLSLFYLFFTLIKNNKIFFRLVH